VFISLFKFFTILQISESEVFMILRLPYNFRL